MNEENRIFEFCNGESPNVGYLCFTAVTHEPSHKLKLIKDVMTIISKYDSTSWPDDNKWSAILPKWFIYKIRANKLEDIIASNYKLWDYGSWLDAIKHRGWEWYSSKISPDKFEIIVTPKSFPFSVNPLEYLIMESGVDYESIYFLDYATLQHPW